MPLELSDSGLDWALEHALRLGDTDIFPSLFEFRALQDNWDDVKTVIKEIDILDWTVRPYRRCLVPKHRFGFRVSTQLDPLDFLVFTSLVWEIGEKLEASRVPITDQIVHSYRFDPDADGRMFGQNSSYRTFQQSSLDHCKLKGVSHVVVADIADFFPRLYTHRIDNALDSALGVGHMHSVALRRLINHWAGTYSYGLPVGSAAARLIAETTISDIDQLLLSEGVDYVRFSDDFRMFATSQADGYRLLTLLARATYENHGLTLQQHKTRIVDVETFRKHYLRENAKAEIETLSEKFYELLEEIGIEDFYEDIDYEALDEEHRNAIDQLNLEGILEEQISQEEPDLSLLKFILKRLGQVKAAETAEVIFENFEVFVPVVRESIEYLLQLNELQADLKSEYGEHLVSLYGDTSSTASHLEYSRMYLMHPFASDAEWGAGDELVKMYGEAVDEFSARELLLALGRSDKDFWFRSRKQYFNQMAPWLRRAFIYAASCLPKDEYKHWIRGITNQLDVTETAIAKWAQKSPIS